MGERAGSVDDRRFMAAAIRLSRHHLGLTGTNPSVGTLIVREDQGRFIVVGRGVTAIGGRPHAETVALAEAGDAAQGATAYVTLEPCAHHGRTPPCAQALIDAGVTRVVGAASDPDPRVNGKGYALLRGAGIEVCPNVLADEAEAVLGGYLSRAARLRPEVTLKLAVSSDGKIGDHARPNLAISGPEAKARTHLLRAEADAILIGRQTAAIDDPLLTCRLPGLQSRSPIRIVLDTEGCLDPESRLVRSAAEVPLLLAVDTEKAAPRLPALRERMVGILAGAAHDGTLALPELLEDLASRGISTLLVEGGAEIARGFLADDLVDRICLVTSSGVVGEPGIASPIREDAMPSGFRCIRRERLGADEASEWIRSCSPAS